MSSPPLSIPLTAAPPSRRLAPRYLSSTGKKAFLYFSSNGDSLLLYGPMSPLPPFIIERLLPVHPRSTGIPNAFTALSIRATEKGRGRALPS